MFDSTMFDKSPKLWANILCDEKFVPYKMIVTDGVVTQEIEIKNTTLKTVIEAAREVYDLDEIITSRVIK